MADNQIEEIKRKIDIVEVISEYVPLKRAGRNFKGLCPFHTEKTPSFMVSSELQIFKCFGCQAGGDCYKFLMEYEKLDFGQALKILAEKAGVKLQPLRGFVAFAQKEEIYRVNSQAAKFYQYLLVAHQIGEAARAYLSRRGIKDESIKFFKLGFAPDRPDALFKFLAGKRKESPELLERAGLVVRRQNQYFDRFRARVTFPLADHHGNILGFSGRVIRDEGDMAKYINSPDTLVYKKGQVLYGLDITKQNIKKEDSAVVVEGEFDLISSWQAGVGNVVAIKGSALTEDQAQLLSRFCSLVYLALDSDPAGDQAGRRGIGIMQISGLDIKVVDLGEFKDPDEAANKNPTFFRRAVKSARGIYDFLIDSAFSKFDSTTADGKEKIGRAILPVLASIDNEIVKAHFIKVAAGRLAISEEAVRLEVDKQKRALPGAVNVPDRSGQTVGVEKKSRRQVLEERLLAILFQTDPQRLLEADMESLVRTTLVRRLLEEFRRFQEEHRGKFEIADFANLLPGELINFFASLVLVDLAAQGQLDVTRETAEVIKAILVLEAREDIGELTRKIKILEQERKLDGVRSLQAELDTCAKKLAELEAS